MTKMLLVGGKLQGTEIAFLAREAGWDVTLLDRRGNPLAMRLCDRFVQADSSSLSPEFLKGYDIVFPAFEDLEGLVELKQACDSAGVPLVFDEKAYRISMSKQATNDFLSNLGVEVPPPIGEAAGWSGGFLVKPDSESGSVGARRFASWEEASSFLERHPSYIGQAFVEGPILSIEVICDRGAVEAYLVTQVVVGEDFDCHRIVVSADFDCSAKRLMSDIGISIGRALDMRGIFDVEAIVGDGRAFVLEIDARMPSQTPIAVYCASGINLVVETARRFLGDELHDADGGPSGPGYAILQHAKVKGGNLELVGEGALVNSSPLVRHDGIYGADIALIGDDGDGGGWLATFVTISGSESEAVAKMECVLSKAAQGGERP